MATLIVGACLVAAAVWYYTAFNSLVRARIGTEQSWSAVEVELKRRLDLIGNLVEVVKGYASHERATLEAVAKQRNPASITASEATLREGEVRGAVRSLFAIAEAYPDLKAHENFQGLSRELIETENRIAERRHAYNQSVSMYQNLRIQIPSNVVASAHGFESRDFFDVPDETVAAVPEVRLS